MTVHFDTTGRIAEKLGVPIHRVLYILRTRPDIEPTAYAGQNRIYDRESVALIRQALKKKVEGWR